VIVKYNVLESLHIQRTGKYNTFIAVKFETYNSAKFPHKSQNERQNIIL
jgi:hypothetical protein